MNLADLAKEIYDTNGNYTETARLLSKKLGRNVHRNTIRSWLVGDTVPLSQDDTKIVDATPEECIAELRRMAEADPDRIVTRNHFRVNSSLAESAWNQHFGTFQEFKRQANITLSRHQHRMELDIAKHASLTRFRDLTAEKREWGENWLKPRDSRYISILVGNDVHDIECSPFWRKCFVETGSRWKRGTSQSCRSPMRPSMSLSR